MHQISVIVSAFDGLKYLPRLLHCLRAQREVEVEVIVVDRHSSDGTAEYLADQKDVLSTQYPPEHGLVAGYHSGVGRASHDLLFFMNDDMWMEAECLRHCAELLLSKPRIAAVMPVQWTYNGDTIVNAGIWYERCWWNRAHPLLRRRERWHLVQEAARVSYANAGACLVRRDAYDEVGGWDKTFFLDYEDIDLAVRLWQRDWECWVEPRAIVGHAVGASNAKSLSAIDTTVGQRRYISACANVVVSGLKTFSWTHWILPILAFLDRSARDVLKWRLVRVGWNVKAAMLTLQRLGDVARYRRRNFAANARRPGERFFQEPAFQYEAIMHNRSTSSHVRGAEMATRLDKAFAGL